MIPPVAETISSVPIPFDESDPDAMLMLGYLKEMYIGKEHPFLVSSRDGFSWLIIPQTIAKVFTDESFRREASEVLRFSTTGGHDGSN